MEICTEMVQQLLAETKKCYEESGDLTDEVLAALNFVFQAPLQHALDLVDRQAVTLLQSPSSRCVYQVIGSSGTPYICFTAGQYCSCPAYYYSILQRGDYVMCKHVLAIRLCEAMNRFKTAEVSDDEVFAAIFGMD